MTQSLILTVDLYPDLSTMTVGDLESLSDQAFTQLEDGPVVEGLLAFYLSLTAEIEDRMALDTSTADDSPATPAATAGGEPMILQAAG